MVELPAEVVVEVLHLLFGVSEQREDDEAFVVQIVEVLVVFLAERGGEAKFPPFSTALESCSGFRDERCGYPSLSQSCRHQHVALRPDGQRAFNWSH